MNYSWDNYVQLQVDAPQDLLDNEEPLQETGKVTLLLQGITDHNLKNSVDVARSNPDLRHNFDKCQLFFSQVLANHSAESTKGQKRKVSAIEGDGKTRFQSKKNGGGKKGGKGQKKGKKGGRETPTAEDLDPNHNGLRPPKVWKAMMKSHPDVCAQIMARYRSQKTRTASTIHRTVEPEDYTTDVMNRLISKVSRAELPE